MGSEHCLPNTRHASSPATPTLAGAWRRLLSLVALQARRDCRPEAGHSLKPTPHRTKDLLKK